MQPSDDSLWWQFKVHVDIRAGSLERGVKRQWGGRKREFQCFQSLYLRNFTKLRQYYYMVLFTGMCTRPFRPRPRRDPRRTGPRPRRHRDVGHFVRDETETETLRVRDETETETFQLPRPWPRRMVKTVKHHKYGSTGLVALCICDVLGFCL